MKKFIDLSAKKIIVVGASSGIGEAVVAQLNDLGAEVFALSRRGVSPILSGRIGVTQISLDVCDQLAIANYAKSLNEEVYGLVYCAGRTGKSTITTINDGLLDEVIDINYKGFIYFIKELMRNRKIAANPNTYGGEKYPPKAPSTASNSPSLKWSALIIA